MSFLGGGYGQDESLLFIGAVEATQLFLGVLCPIVI